MGNYDPEVRATFGSENVKAYVKATLEKESTRNLKKLFQVQTFYQQQVAIRKEKNKELNEEIHGWVQNGDLQGVNFLEMNFVCTKGPEISRLLGATVSTSDAEKCSASCQ